LHPIKKILIRILKALGIYHPLQSRYRRILLQTQNKKLRRSYAGYRGSGFTCNFCGSSFSKFAPRYPKPQDRPALDRNKVIAGYGENVYCPECMSTSRERLILAMLTSMNIRGKKVLHLAPEEKIYRIVKSNCLVTTADIMPGFYSTTDKHIKYADVTMLPFADHCFDIVIANHVLEHIPDDRKAMKEIYRVLNQEGMAILQVPFSEVNLFTIEDQHINDPKKQSALFGQEDHVRIYSLQDYLKRLAGSGFTVDYTPFESLGDFYKYAIQPGEGFIRLRKK
jgi:SAM-dependent methyltransferase